MDSEKRAYISALEERKSKISKKIAEYQGKKEGALSGYYEAKIAQLKGEIKKIDDLVSSLKASTDSVEINYISKRLIDVIDSRITRKEEKKARVQDNITHIDEAIANSKTNTGKRILEKIKESRTKKVADLDKKIVKLQGRQRFIVTPKSFIDNFRNYRLGRKEAMSEYMTNKYNDTKSISDAYKESGTILGAAKGLIYDIKGFFYKKSQIRYQNAVDRIKNKIVRLEGARTTTVPAPSVAPSLT